MTSLANPKAYLFIGATFPLFIREYYGPIWAQAVVLSILTASVQIGIYGGIAYAIVRAGDVGLISSRTSQIGARLAGGILVAMAAAALLNSASL